MEKRVPVRVINSNYQWYVLRVEGAYEKKASLALQVYGSAGAVPDFKFIRRLWVPEITIQQGRGKDVKKKRVSTIPGYLFLEALLSEKLYAALKRPDLPHVFGWLQHRRSWPSVVDVSEIDQLVYWEQLDVSVVPTVPLFVVGERVTVPSLDITGVITSITDAALYLGVEFFHRMVICKVDNRCFSEVVRM